MPKLKVRTFRTGEEIGGSAVVQTVTVMYSTDVVGMVCGGAGGTCNVRFGVSYGVLARVEVAVGRLFCPACQPPPEPPPKYGEGPEIASKSYLAFQLLKKGYSQVNAAREVGITTQTVEMVRLRWIVEPAYEKLKAEVEQLRRENEVLRRGKA